MIKINLNFKKLFHNRKEPRGISRKGIFLVQAQVGFEQERQLRSYLVRKFFCHKRLFHEQELQERKPFFVEFEEISFRKPFSAYKLRAPCDDERPVLLYLIRGENRKANQLNSSENFLRRRREQF